MTNNPVQEVDVLVSEKSIKRANRLTEKFKEADKELTEMLVSLQAMEKALKAFEGSRIFKTRRSAQNYMAGAANQADLNVRRVSSGGEARSLSLLNTLLRVEREREALELSRSRRLSNNAAQIAKINSLDEANLRVRAAELRLGDALSQQDTRKINSARQLLTNLEARRKLLQDTAAAEAAALAKAQKLERETERARQVAAARAEAERKRAIAAAERAAVAAQRELEATQRRNAIEERIIQRNTAREAERRAAAAERAARAAEKEAAALEKRRMQPVTDRINTQRSRELTEMRLFGDGGASLFKIQTGLMMNYALINQVSSSFATAVRESVAFDASLRELQAIVQVSDGSLERLKGNLIEVANSSRFTANEVAKASIMLGQAGLSSDQIQAAIGSVMQLATATGTDLTRSVDIATSILGIFNMEAGRMEHVANALTQALNKSKLDIEKLTLGIQYAGNTAFDAGVSFEELTAGLGAMSNAGIRSGSTLGTGMRQILVSLEKPSETFQKRLKALGLSMNDISLESKGLYGVMQTLRDAGFSASDAIESFEVRSAAAFIALSNNLPMMQDMETSLYRTAAASEASATQMRSLDSQIKRFNGNLTTVVYQAIEPMMYAFRDLLSGFSDFLSALAGSPASLREFGTAITAAMVGFAGFKTIGLVVGLLKLMPVDLNAVTVASTRATLANTNFGLSLAAIRSNLLASSIGLRSFAAGTVGVETAFVALRLGVGALLSTIGLVAPVLAGISLAYYALTSATQAYSNETTKQGDAINVWKSRVEASNGVTERYKAKISEVETKIKSLNNRYQELNKNQSALKAEIERVRVQFAGMSSTVNGTESSVDQLISKLGALWAQLQKEYILRIGIEIQNIEGLLAMQQVQFNTALTDFNTKLSSGDLTGDPVADAALQAWRSAGDDLQRNEARKAFDARITELSNQGNTGEIRQAAERSVRNQYNIPDNMSLEEGLARNNLTVEEIIPMREESLLADTQEIVNKGVTFQQGLQSLGDQELAILQTKDQKTQRDMALGESQARLQMQPIFESAEKTSRQVDDTLRKFQSDYRNDPTQLYTKSANYAEGVVASLDEQIRQIEASDQPETVKAEAIGRLGEIKGKLATALDPLFSDYKAFNDMIGKRVSYNTNEAYQQAAQKLNDPPTEAAAAEARQGAETMAHKRMMEAKEQLRKQIPIGSGQSVEDPTWQAQMDEIDRSYANDLAEIETRYNDAITGIREGMGGENVAARKKHDDFMDTLSTSDQQVKTAYELGKMSRDEVVDVLNRNTQSAQDKLSEITPLVDAMTPQAEAGLLNAEDQQTYRRLVQQQGQLKDYINNNSDATVRVLNSNEFNDGADTMRRQNFERTVNGWEDRLQQIDNDVVMERSTEGQAATARASIGTEVKSQLSKLETELKPYRDKLASGQRLSSTEEAVFRQGVSEENRLADLYRRTADLRKEGGGGGGGKADAGEARDFSLMMDELKTELGDAQGDLKYGDAPAPEAVGRMDAVIARAKEELAIRREQMKTQKEGSAEYNRLRSEERTLLGFIREEEENIREVKEEQGLAQLDLNKSVQQWAQDNLNISNALESGFFNVLDSMRSGLSTLFSDLMSGTKSAKEAFRDFGMSVVESIQNVIAEMMAMYVMKKILGFFDYEMTGVSGPSIQPIAATAGKALAAPEDVVKQRNPIDVVGVESMNQMSSLQERVTQNTGHAGVAKQEKGPLGMTNVYVVPPEQRPVPGPHDIIAVINDDIARGGSTKKLIKSVAMGY